MTTYRLNRLTWVALAVAGLGACTQAATPAQPTIAPAAQVAPGTADATPAALPRMTVHKTPTCGCCSAWIDHVRDVGFAVDVHDMDDLGPVKERLGVPYAKGSCHTAEVGGYLIEGHVPAADVKRLLEKSRTHAAWSCRECRLVRRAWRSRMDASRRTPSSWSITTEPPNRSRSTDCHGNAHKRGVASHLQ